MLIGMLVLELLLPPEVPELNHDHDGDRVYVSCVYLLQVMHFK